MSHEMPFKKLIWKFFTGSWLAKVLAKFFAGKPYSRAIHETVTKLSVQSWKAWDLDHLTPSWAYIWNWSRKHPENMFFTQKQLEKLWKTWVIQITSKSKQKEQKSFWFDPHMVEHTHITFEHVQSHKWNRHSLNIKLVCCVCGSSVE